MKKVILTTAETSYDYSSVIESVNTPLVDDRGRTVRKVTIEGSAELIEYQIARYGSGLHPTLTPEELEVEREQTKYPRFHA